MFGSDPLDLLIVGSGKSKSVGGAAAASSSSSSAQRVAGAQPTVKGKSKAMAIIGPHTPPPSQVMLLGFSARPSSGVVQHATTPWVGGAFTKNPFGKRGARIEGALFREVICASDLQGQGIDLGAPGVEGRADGEEVQGVCGGAGRVRRTDR